MQPEAPAERSARYVAREQRGLRREVLIEPLAALGLVAMNGPNDPADEDKPKLQRARVYLEQPLLDRSS